MNDEIKKRGEIEMREYFLPRWTLIKTEVEIFQLPHGCENIRASAKNIKDSECSRVRVSGF